MRNLEESTGGCSVKVRPWRWSVGRVGPPLAVAALVVSCEDRAQVPQSEGNHQIHQPVKIKGIVIDKLQGEEIVVCVLNSDGKVNRESMSLVADDGSFFVEPSASSGALLLQAFLWDSTSGKGNIGQYPASSPTAPSSSGRVELQLFGETHISIVVESGEGIQLPNPSLTVRIPYLFGDVQDVPSVVQCNSGSSGCQISLRPRAYRGQDLSLWIAVPGYQSCRVMLPKDEGDYDLGVIALGALEAMSIAVKNAKGAPVSGARVQSILGSDGVGMDYNKYLFDIIMSPEPSVLFSPQSSEETTGPLGDAIVFPGGEEFLLSVMHPEYCNWSRRFEQMPGEHFEVTMLSGGRLEVEVHGDLRSVWVRPLGRQSARASRRYYCDDEGMLRLEHMAAGRYEVFIDEKHPDCTTTVRVEEGADARVVFTRHSPQ